MRNLIVLIWRCIRRAWLSENYPAWRLSLPNLLPRRRADADDQGRPSGSGEHLLVNQDRAKLD